jgi:hypothetical protein
MLFDTWKVRTWYWEAASKVDPVAMLITNSNRSKQVLKACLPSSVMLRVTHWTSAWTFPIRQDIP